MICFKAVHFSAPFISASSNSPLREMNCLRQSRLLYRIGRSKPESVAGQIGSC
jgi:hypothetical protein